MKNPFPLHRAGKELWPPLCNLGTAGDPSGSVHLTLQPVKFSCTAPQEISQLGAAHTWRSPGRALDSDDMFGQLVGGAGQLPDLFWTHTGGKCALSTNRHENPLRKHQFCAQYVRSGTHGRCALNCPSQGHGARSRKHSASTGHRNNPQADVELWGTYAATSTLAGTHNVDEAVCTTTLQYGKR